MGRPAKPVNEKSKSRTKEEINTRMAVDESLKGSGFIPDPPDYLTEEQLEIYQYISNSLDESKVLGHLDGYILAGASICISQMHHLDEEYNQDPEIIYNPQYRNAKTEIAKEFFRFCNELCLSPQARAKLSISAYKATTEEKKTLMDILNEEDD